MDKVFYESVLKRVKAVVYRIHPTNVIDPEEMISEAFLEGLPMNVDDYVNWIIKKVGLKENRFQKNEKEVKDQRYCRMCKDYYNAGYFRSWYLRGYLIFDSYCKDCKNKYLKEYKRKKRKAAKETKK